MWGAIKSALAFLAGLVGLGEKVTAEVHDRNQRDAGAAAQQSADKDAVIAAQQRQEKAAVNAETSTDALVKSMKDRSF